MTAIHLLVNECGEVGVIFRLHPVTDLQLFPQVALLQNQHTIQKQEKNR